MEKCFPKTSLGWLDVLSDKSISIFIPVYNEAANLADNIQILIKEVAPFFNNYEIFIVDDGSTDNTSDVLKSLSGINIKSIRNPQNMGKGFALRESFRHASGDYVFFIDGGMELHPKELRIFLGLLLIYNADIIVGSKRHPQSQVYYPLMRRILSVIYQGIIRLVFNLRITDTQVGLKLFRADVLRKVLPSLKINGYGFDLELLIRANKLGFTSILEAPIQLDYFTKNKRSFFTELVHVFKISIMIAVDTFKIFWSTRK